MKWLIARGLLVWGFVFVLNGCQAVDGSSEESQPDEISQQQDDAAPSETGGDEPADTGDDPVVDPGGDDDPVEEPELELEDPITLDEIERTVPDAPELVAMSSCVTSSEGCAEAPILEQWVCPEGWMVETSEDGAQSCTPDYPEEACESLELSLPGFSECHPVGRNCPEGLWPTDLPADARRPEPPIVCALAEKTDRLLQLRQLYH